MGWVAPLAGAAIATFIAALCRAPRWFVVFVAPLVGVVGGLAIGFGILFLVGFVADKRKNRSSESACEEPSKNYKP